VRFNFLFNKLFSSKSEKNLDNQILPPTQDNSVHFAFVAFLIAQTRLSYLQPEQIEPKFS
jgi:hypothetical protein